MGQAWVDGFLPYTLLWDLKPPLVFLYFAKIIYLFGKSLLAIRFFGAVIVGFNGYLLYRIARKHTTSIYALTLGVFTIYFQSLFGSVQGVMSEHLGLFPVLLGSYLFVEKRNFYLISLAIGVLIVSTHGNNVDLMHVLFGTVLALDDTALILLCSFASVSLLVLALLFRPLVLECADPRWTRKTDGKYGTKTLCQRYLGWTI